MHLVKLSTSLTKSRALLDTPIEYSENEKDNSVAYTTSPSTNSLLNISIDTIRSVVKKFKDDVHVAQALTRIPTAPIPRKTTVESVKIKTKRMNIPGTVGKVQLAESFEAEWIDYYGSGDYIHGHSLERVILFIHGGAYFVGSVKTHRGVTWRLSKYAHAKVLSIDYRLAPTHTFPTPIVDIISAYQYLINPPDPSLKKYLPSQVAFAGDSAGGCLAISAAMYCRDHDIPMPGACVGLSPWLDLTQSFPAWHINAKTDMVPDSAEDPRYIGPTRSNVYVMHDDDLVHPYASPIFAKETSIQLPPMLLQVGEAERLRDDSIFFMQKTMPHTPIRLEMYAGRPHDFVMFAPVDELAEVALKNVGTFLYAQIGLRHQRDTVNRAAVRICDTEGFPVENIDNVFGIVEDGVAALVKAGVWRKDKVDGGYEVHFV